MAFIRATTRLCLFTWQQFFLLSFYFRSFLFNVSIAYITLRRNLRLVAASASAAVAAAAAVDVEVGWFERVKQVGL